MGYSPGLLDLVVEWSKQFDIRPGARVLDIGTQELFCADDPASLNRFVGHFGAEPYAEEELKRMADRTFAAELFQRAGFAYKAVDITPYRNTLRIDLNTGRLPFWHRRRYSLVANCGTTEHIVNQLNAFRLIHDACAIGGLMYHGVPIAGDFTHGLFNYTPLFFVRLAEANGYEVMKAWGWASDAVKGCDVIGKVEWNRPFATQDAWINILLRRARGGAFCAPVDCVSDHKQIA